MNMLNSLKQTGRNIGHEISQAWDSLSEGWRELLSRNSDALTHFKRHKDDSQPAGDALAMLPRWGLLAGELEETPTDVVVRVELPGMDKDDCRILIEGNRLQISGERRFERESSDSTYHVMERAYGAFQQSIPLPHNVAIERAEARLENGVLTVRLPKEGVDRTHSIPVS